jgi:hypothetical protein
LAKKKEVADKQEPEVKAPAVEAPPAAPKPATKSLKVGKLPPKNKSRLPRLQKKAKKKAEQKAKDSAAGRL